MSDLKAVQRSHPRIERRAGSAGQPEVQELLEGTVGSAEDKLRMAILFLLLSEKLPADAEVESIQAALQKEGADVEAFKYVLRMRQMNLTGQSMVSGVGASSSHAQGSLLGLVDSSIMSGIAGQFGKQLTKLVGGTRQVRRSRPPLVPLWPLYCVAAQMDLLLTCTRKISLAMSEQIALIQYLLTLRSAVRAL